MSRSSLFYQHHNLKIPIVICLGTLKLWPIFLVSQKICWPALFLHPPIPGLLQWTSLNVTEQNFQFNLHNMFSEVDRTSKCFFAVWARFCMHYCRLVFPTSNLVCCIRSASANLLPLGLDTNHFGADVIIHSVLIIKNLSTTICFAISRKLSL